MAGEKYTSDKKWNEFILYDCKFCEFNTLDEEEMKKHVRFHRGDAATSGTTTPSGSTSPARTKTPSQDAPAS